MSAVKYALEPVTLSYWQKPTEDVSAKAEIGVRPYSASEVLLIPVNSAECDGQHLRAKRPLAVKLTTEEQGVLAENDTLHICAHGSNAKEAMADFRSQLFELYAHYSRLRESDVTGRAVRLRKAFIQNFELVTSK